jgi:hypothetical protein
MLIADRHDAGFVLEALRVGAAGTLSRAGSDVASGFGRNEDSR